VEHVVFFPAPDGSPAFRRVASLDEAVRLVEHLRNVEGVSTVSVHALTEVPLSFRAYYRVEVPTEASAGQAELPRVEPIAAPEPVVGLVPEQPEVPALALVPDDREQPVAPQSDDEPVPAASNGHAKEAPTSLGFFA
jgi:hypothetical protein